MCTVSALNTEGSGHNCWMLEVHLLGYLGTASIIISLQYLVPVQYVPPCRARLFCDESRRISIRHCKTFCEPPLEEGPSSSGTLPWLTRRTPPPTSSRHGPRSAGGTSKTPLIRYVPVFRSTYSTGQFKQEDVLVVIVYLLHAR